MGYMGALLSPQTSCKSISIYYRNLFKKIGLEFVSIKQFKLMTLINKKTYKRNPETQWGKFLDSFQIAYNCTFQSLAYSYFNFHLDLITFQITLLNEIRTDACFPFASIVKMTFTFTGIPGPPALYRLLMWSATRKVRGAAQKADS